MFRKYLSNTAGNVGMMFAVISGTVVIGVGAAIDMSSALSQRNTMQSLSDAAVLAAVTSGETEYDKVKAFVEQSLAANNQRNWDIDWKLTIKDETATVELGSIYNTQLMGFVGKKTMPIAAVSEAKFPVEIPINISLVLDTTDSMAGANMDGLKAASAVLVDIFKEFDADTRVAVVPFSDYVNVGVSRRYENWITVPPDETINVPAGSCYMHQPRTCTSSETITEDYVQDGVTRTRTRTNCFSWEDDGPEVEHCPSAYTREIKWNGCIGSRSGLYNKTAAYKGKQIPGVMNQTCGEEVLTLTDDMTAVKAKINSLTTRGNTYIPAGLINGWRMLDADRPFESLSNKEEKRKRALVLMTDGKNTRSISDPYEDGEHEDSDEDAANALTSELCQNIKAANIDVWTVAYNFDDANSKAILQNCASTASQFFDASNQAQLKLAFEEIGNSLFTARLSR